LYEIKVEPDCVIYMSACPLLDIFKKYLEISVVFVLSICTATANTTIGNGNFRGIFLGKGVGNILKKGSL